MRLLFVGIDLGLACIAHFVKMYGLSAFAITAILFLLQIVRRFL